MIFAMTESEELTKLVDTVYKNILDKFNPSARQLISAGKNYLKALHGASAASNVYIDAITRIARHAQQATWGGATDIGAALMQIVDVHKEILAQQMNILKAFYVDLLVPLESNLEKDTKVVQAEQKKFMQQHKARQDAYLKAASVVKKLRKKTRSTRSSASIEKELKHMQTLEEEKMKLDGYCELSLKSVITQERRRYGFVLERQCSLAKHNIAFYGKGQSLLQHHLEEWQEIAKTREYLPDKIEAMFPARPMYKDDMDYPMPLSELEVDRLSTHSSTLRKYRSIDASCMDLHSLKDLAPSPKPLSRAKSDFNLAASSQSLTAADIHLSCRPRSMAVANENGRKPMVRALYSYLSSGDHQLNFTEGDIIALIGERNKGWQYGENVRNRRSGWFPVAYTETLDEERDSLENMLGARLSSIDITSPLHIQYDPFSRPPTTLPRSQTISNASELFGTSSTLKRSATTAPLRSEQTAPPPPPPLPPPPDAPTPPVTNGKDVTVTATTPAMGMTPLPAIKRSMTSPAPFPPPRPGSSSLHSSNDSGFGNETSTPAPNGEPENVADRNSVFATVKLRKVVTNDRSAPHI